MDVMMQFPSLSLGSPILPSSPMCDSNPLDGKNEMGNLFCSSPLGFKYFGDSKKQFIIEELKPTSFENFKLSDVAGHIIEFSPDQRKMLAEQLSGHMLPLSLQMHGCRVIQKSKHIYSAFWLSGRRRPEIILNNVYGQVATLSTHPYGCRVIQRVLEDCSDERNIQRIVDEILQYACFLAEEQYGNYVIQETKRKRFEP
ncbi:hypothetical protein PIB30_012674 [Stylosanthes scabra]|uniref:PUM-HD domain-containing protein n=1 Tax=Stylosanthes scabra TaxID=79078 RepID=A0ABU6Q6W7_9FABA|nr:hypothetical protein [Stylosanthes scabra]